MYQSMQDIEKTMLTGEIVLNIYWYVAENSLKNTHG